MNGFQWEWITKQTKNWKLASKYCKMESFNSTYVGLGITCYCKW